MRKGTTISDGIAVQATITPRPIYDPLLLIIIASAVILSGLIFMMFLSWGTGQALGDTPWYIPVTHSFAGLAAFSVAFLAFGRYPVERDAASYWIGMGYVAIGVQSAFFILAWPGLLPDGRAIIARHPSTSGWIAMFELASLSLALLAAVVSRWPGWSPERMPMAGRRWLWSVAIWIGLVIIICTLFVVYEQHLPVLVGPQGNLTPLILSLDWVFLLLFIAGAILSARRYRQTGDALQGYVALNQIALTFVVLTAIIGAKRYDIWYYLSRIIIVSGFLSMMFGLLAEYARLFRREREGRLMLDAILENIPVGLAVTGGPPAFPLARVSRHGLEMNQRPVEGLIETPAGQHQAAWKIYLPDGVTQPMPEQMPLYRASRLGEEIRNLEMVMEAQDGRKIPVLVNAAPIRDATGQIVAAINTWLDITELKEAEAALRESELFYRQTLESIPGMVFTTRPDGYCDYQSQQWVDYTGVPMSEHLGDGWNKLLHPEDQPRAFAAWLDAVEGKAPYNLEYRVRRHDGAYQWFKVIGQPICDESGQIVRWFGVAMNIEELKRAEEELRLAYGRLQAVFDNRIGGIGIVISSAWGEILQANDYYLNLLGYSREELLTSQVDWRRMTPQEWLPADEHGLQQLQERGVCDSYEKEYLRRDGSRVPVLIAKVMMPGDTGDSLTYVIDITHRKQTEEALQKYAADLERANRDLQNFTVMASHDLQEPLRKIQALGDTVLSGASDLDENLTDRIQRMRNSALQMRKMVDALLQLSLLSTDTQTFQPVDLHQIANEILADKKEQIEQSGGAVDVGDLPIIKADPLQMRRLFQHLIENALKFQSPGGKPRITITSKLLASHTVQILIEDNGIGFDEAHAGQLFEPFERLVGKNQPQYDGVGMGLAICRWIVERHDGKIAAQSKPGQGTTFIVTLPVQQLNSSKNETEKVMDHGKPAAAASR